MDYLLKYHPLHFINKESLIFIRDILASLSRLIRDINEVSGGIKEHVDELKKAIIKSDDSNMDEQNRVEKVMVRYLFDALEKMDSSIVKNVSSTYFAQSLKSMISDIEREFELEEKTGLVLNIANLENMKHYKVCFFQMNKADNYPRIYRKDFPFNNKEILEILTLPKYKICRKPANINGLESHLKLEQYLFKNLLDFTDEELIITMTEKEDQKRLIPSIYIQDIWTIFGYENKWVSSVINDRKVNLDFNVKRMPSNQFKTKDKYSLNELATFKMCPRLYYYMNGSMPLFYYTKHQFQFYFIAVLFSQTLNEFKKYNRLNKKVYRVPGNDAINICNDIFSHVYTEHIPIFYIFSNYELTLDYDTKVFDMDNNTNRISQNAICIDFLVLKTTDNEKKPLKHYNDMVRCLNNNEAGCDRVNLVMKITGKINIQFDSVRFANDGIKRTDELVR